MDCPPRIAIGQDQAAMTEFMRNLGPNYVKGIADKDEELKKLLLGMFKADWSKAKECLLFDRWPIQNARHPAHDAELALDGGAGEDAFPSVPRSRQGYAIETHELSANTAGCL